MQGSLGFRTHGPQKDDPQLIVMDPEIQRSVETVEKINTWMLTQFVAAKSMLEAEEGQGLVEYGLILALIAAVCVVALQLLGTNVSGMLNDLAGKITP